jgi:hypothetical protein
MMSVVCLNLQPMLFGRFVVVAGEKSDMLSSYAIDTENGALKLIGRYPTGKGANWIEILVFDESNTRKELENTQEMQP